MESQSFIKGSSIKAVKEFIVKHGGDESYQKVIDGMSADSRSVIGNKSILSSTWYPMDVYVDFLKSVKNVLGKDNKIILYETGSYIIEYGYNAFYKLFYRFGSPQFILKNSKYLWSSYFKPSRLTVVKTTETSALLRVEGEPLPDKVLCESTAGGMEQSAKLSGAKNIKIQETQCRVTGSPYCEYDITWEL